MASTLTNLIKQQRFRILLIALVLLSLFIGVMIVPVEQRAKGALLTTVETGVWWAVTTITGVGYGDVYPVTSTGRVLGMVLELTGVLAFGLLVAMVAVAIERKEERWYWNRLFERLTALEERLKGLEKKEEFAIKKNVK